MYHERTKTRDLALLTLMLGTGIRVSECVGLDIDDVDLKNNGIKIHRKGGAEVIVYFSDEVAEAVCKYLEERMEILQLQVMRTLSSCLCRIDGLLYVRLRIL